MSRPRRSREEWSETVKQYRESGLSQQAFCERENLSVATLRYWLYRPEQKQARFVQVVAPNTHESVSTHSSFAVVLLCGIRIELPVEHASKFVLQLIEASNSSGC